MVDAVVKNAISVSKLMGSMELYKNNPTAIQRVVLDYLEAVTNAEVDIVDPTNPFVFLLEASAVQTALAVNETRLSLRKQYPSLAQSEEELYMHMSDYDYVDRFATPSETIITFLVNYNSFITHAPRDENEGCQKATIARNTEVNVGNWTFSLEYPIDIRRYDNGMVQITYNADSLSPLRSLSTNVIDFVATKTADGTYLLKFQVPMSQFKIDTTEFPVQTSTSFSKKINYSDNYWYCRVFYKKEKSGSGWREMQTTHTDQVYDIYKPTAVLKVLNSEKGLVVSIPSVYINSQVVDGVVRVDIYTTKGKLSEDLSNYQLTSFTTTLRAIDEEKDVTEYTAAMSDIVYMAYSDDMATGGSDPLSFLDLRERVIMNAVGINQLPITNAQLVSFMERKGFQIVKNVDMVTNRIFIATKNLPDPSNTRLITAANISVETFVCNMAKLPGLPGVDDNGERITIRSNTLFRYDNGFIDIAEKSDLNYFASLSNTKMSEVSKQSKFLYTPFYYVLDNSDDEFDLRAYHLDQPALTNLSFVKQNASALLQVNTGSYSIVKTKTGYKIIIVTKSTSTYKELPGQSYLQMSILPDGERYPVYLMAKYVGKQSDDERIFEFDIETKHDIDSRHRLHITNLSTENVESLTVPVKLESQISLFYITTSVPVDFRSSDIDQNLGSFQLPANSVGVTHEVLDVTFGHALTNLWTQCRSVSDIETYTVYEQDVPMVYTEDVYETDPETGFNFKIDPKTGQPVYKLLHEAGDLVMKNGEIVYSHRKGDPVIDENLRAKILGEIAIKRHCDMLFVDGSYYFATDPNYQSYLKELANVLDQWIYTDLQEIDHLLLEQTKIYYYPKKSVGAVTVMLTDDSKASVDAEQSFVVVLYVRDTVFKDAQLREEITRKTVVYLNNALQANVVSSSAIISDLKAVYGDSVVSFNFSGLGGEANYDIMSLSNPQQRLCLKKHLIPQEDGTMVVAEDVTVNFINFTQT